MSQLDPPTIQRVLEHADPEPRGKYRHWHTLRNLTAPGGLTSEQWWAGVKLQREALLRQVGGFTDLQGTPFRYARVDGLLERLQHLDHLTAGNVAIDSGASSAPWADQQERYVIRNFIEEAIASSQLEGASTTRKRAKEMLRHGERPTTKAERMILNNYHGITRIVEVAQEPLTPDLIRELHKILTEGTLTDPSAEGRFQTPAEQRVVVGSDTSLNPHYVPPPAEEVPRLIDALCEFANEAVGPPWVHPLVRALTLHFMLGWIHPFEDGNGRTARALFYWSAIRSDYWLVQYLSVSRVLLAAPGQYATSFLETETDENDLTYFIIYQLEVIERAVTDLLKYASEQARESRQLRRKLQHLDLNHRERALLAHALVHPDAQYTFYSHSKAHQVVPLTARNDLIELERLGLLVRSGKVGRANAYSPAPNVHARIDELARR